MLESSPGIRDVVCRSVPAARRKRTHAADAASLINEADRKVEESVRGLLLEREKVTHFVAARIGLAGSKSDQGPHAGDLTNRF